MKIDVHAHYSPPEFLAEIGRGRGTHGCAVEVDANGGMQIRFGDGPTQEVRAELSDLGSRLERTRQGGLDKQVLLPPMGLWRGVPSRARDL